MGLDDVAVVEKRGGGRKEQGRVRGQKSKGEKEGRVSRDVRAQGPPLVIKSRIFHTVSHKNHIYLLAYLRPTARRFVPPLHRGNGQDLLLLF